MPTHNRRLFVPKAIEYFQRQDYTDRELIIVDDGSDAVSDLIPVDPRIRYIQFDQRYSLGTKRNLACEEARGEVIIHWDDDDWMAERRIRYQLDALLAHNADICGLNEMLFYDPVTRRAWRYRFPFQRNIQLVAGGSLCYTKRFWCENRFAEVDVGEDTLFIWSKRPKKLMPLADFAVYVAITHAANTNPRRINGSRWCRYSLEKVHTLMGRDFDFYLQVSSKNNKTTLCMPDTAKTHSGASRKQITAKQPLVTCIMPTRNRRPFVVQSLKYFHRQDYPSKELVIVDDGDDDLSDLTAFDDRIRYIRLKKRVSVGEKRNLALQQAAGSIIAHWDDDDWYAPDRLSYQVKALRESDADICGLDVGLFFDICEQSFWRCTPALHRNMFFANIHGRSMMYHRKVWERLTKYPNRSLGEDADFLKEALARNARLEKLCDGNKLIYIRHGANTWQFTCGQYIDAGGWQVVEQPSFMLLDDMRFYSRLRQEADSCSGHPVGLTAWGRNSACSTESKDGSPHAGTDLRVTVSIPYFGCADTIRRAVESILGQVHRDLTLVVVNDGDESPWRLLEDIDDERLIRFDLQSNRGRYFADAVVLNATDSTYFLVQDADDWSEPERISTLLQYLHKEQAVGAFSASKNHYERGQKGKRIIRQRPNQRLELSERLVHHIDHTGLYEVSALHAIGGYYGGFRVGYDTLITNLLLMTGRLAFTDDVLYHRFIRASSLTKGLPTRVGSEMRANALSRLRQMYTEAFYIHKEFLHDKLDREVLCQKIREICSRYIDPESATVLKNESRRLRRTIERDNTKSSNSSPVKLCQYNRDLPASLDSIEVGTGSHNAHRASTPFFPKKWIAVVMTYERPLQLLELLRDLEEEKKRGIDVEVRVYDDASHSDYSAPKVIIGRNGWRYSRADLNHGKHHFWRWISHVYQELIDIDSNTLIAFLQDDLRLCNRFFERAEAEWSAIQDSCKVSLNIHIDESRNTRPCWTGVRPRRVGSQWQTQWVDQIFVADRRFLEAIDFEVPPVSWDRWRRDPSLSTGVGQALSRKLHRAGLHMYRVDKSLVVHVDGQSLMNNAIRDLESMTTMRYIDGVEELGRRRRPTRIIASLATIPSRESMLHKVVDCLLPQVDQLKVYLNRHTKIPEFLKHQSIQLAWSANHGDLGDSGKFFWCEDDEGYLLACDDDLIYPEDYVPKLVAAVERYRRQAVAGFHGVLLKPRVRSYYRDRTVYHFSQHLKKDKSVHIVGTGCAAWHSSGLELNIAQFKIPNMTDIWLGKTCQERQVPVLTLSRKEGWLRAQTVSDSIYDRYVRDDSIQTGVVTELGTWRAFPVKS